MGESVVSFEKRNTAVKLLLTVIIVIFLGKFFYLPKIKRTNELKKKLIELSGERSTVEKILNAAKNEKDKIQQESEKLFSIKEEFFTEGSFPDGLRKLMDLIPELKLEVLSINYLPQKVFRVYKEIPVEINLKGEYHNFVDYLVEIEKFSKSISIGEIQIQSDGERHPRIEVKVVFCNYILRDEDKNE